MEGDNDDASVGSDTTSKSSGHNTNRTNRTTTANRTQRRNQRKRKESRGQRPTNARKEDERHKGRVVLSLFRDSPKEGALTYTDWCCKVEEYIRKGYDDNRIRMPCCLPSRDRLTLTSFLRRREESHSGADLERDGQYLQRFSHLPGLKCPDVWAETGNE